MTLCFSFAIVFGLLGFFFLLRIFLAKMSFYVLFFKQIRSLLSSNSNVDNQLDLRVWFLQFIF